jgi:hypothetical protein
MLGYIVSRFNIFNKEHNAPLAHNENMVQSVIPNIIRVNQMKNVQREGLALFERKNKDYGDAFARYGTIGVLMRMGDKISRLQSITKNGNVLVNDEQMRDTLIDLHNYSAMAIMLLDEGRDMNIEDAAYTDEYPDDPENNYKQPILFGVTLLVSSAGFVMVRTLLRKW